MMKKKDRYIQSLKEIEKALFKFGDFCIKEYRENKDTMEEMKKYHDNIYTKEDILLKGVKQEPDWKPLEIENLPSDILTGDYEFIAKVNIELGLQPFKDTSGGRCSLLNEISMSKKEYCYREATPTKMTNEDLADEYVNNRLWATYSAKKIAIDAFIAGRKSMETE